MGRTKKGDAMPKSEVTGAARRTREDRLRDELPSAVEGQVAELCRDLDVQAKRMRQLQEQADELRTVIRQWASELDRDRDREPVSRGRR
jgi:hypothetical protein